jgi:hypothetical protein
MRRSIAPAVARGARHDDGGSWNREVVAMVN